ncbi:MAG: viperin family antiviral radical SAM protein [Nostoc sp.]|uniref:viperin family antiviral radical SAM protein n=1 Tax=Nostoc sp. TaxID=1180 RepID=UPI002FF51E1D
MDVRNLVINYHLTELCNYSCEFCFAKYGLEGKFNTELHRNVDSVKLMLEDVFRHFRKSFKSIRLNFAGGEPLLVANLIDIVDAALSIGYEVSIITNGSLIKPSLISNLFQKMSTIGISIDSFNSETNRQIGRSTKNKCDNNIRQFLEEFKKLPCTLKINTVVNRHNWQEDMSASINEINPDKWKIFKVLTIQPNTIGITNEQYQYFIETHREKVETLVFAENNDDMRESYIMIDPLGRFYQNSDNCKGYVYSDRILELGTEKAFEQIVFDKIKFNQRYVAL